MIIMDSRRDSDALSVSVMILIKASKNEDSSLNVLNLWSSKRIDAIKIDVWEIYVYLLEK